MLHGSFKKYLSFCALLGLLNSAPAQQNLPGGNPRPAAQPVSAPGAYSSGTNINYVRTRTASAPIKDLSSFQTSGTDRVQEVTSYLDGLGRALQSVTRQGSPGLKDIVQPKVYDGFGREPYSYLPYVSPSASGGFKTDPFSEQAAFMSVQYNGESVFYAETRFEASPLNRVLKTLAPGNSWAGNDKGITTQFFFNDPFDSVRVWNIDQGSNALPVSNSIYAAGQLIETHTIDEHNKAVVEYKDKDGKTILKKVQVGDTPSAGACGWLCTYYIYDDLGLLRFVISPKANEWLAANNWILSTGTSDELCFRYGYDAMNRMVTKKVPGAGEVIMVYDKRDRLVFTQDANMRTRHKWLVTLYDNLNRPATTGMIDYTGSREELQQVTDAQFDAGMSTSLTIQATSTIRSIDTLFVNKRKAGDTLYTAGREIQFLPGFTTEDGAGFQTGFVSTVVTTGSNTVQQFSYDPLPPGSSLVALTFTYYDNYAHTGNTYRNADNGKLDDGGNASPETLPASSSLLTTGMVTGTKVRILKDPQEIGAGGWLETTSFYDEKARSIQVQADNNKGGKDIATSRYDFSGKPVTTYLLHTNPAASVTLRTKTNMLYDHAGRLLHIQKTLNDDNSTTRYLVRNEYDELGMLTNKQLGQKSLSDQSAMELQAYEYNIRGWLKGFNKGYAGNTADAWFGMELSYDHGFTANQFNGNIAGVNWRSKGDGKQRAFGYGYDAANRFLFGDFNQFEDGNWNKSSGLDFSVKMGNGIDYASAYDANGNIKGMRQNGWKLGGSTMIDDLVYTYLPNSNKLQNVIDANNDTETKLGDFKSSRDYMESMGGNKTSSVTDYTYDVNGNLGLDRNKDISNIVYNHLNLPYQVTVAGKGVITYTYDANGNKLSKQTKEHEPYKNTATDYIGGMVYSNDSLQLIGHEEGRIRQKDDLYVYDYFIKDHLGNIRMVLTEEEQADAYLVAAMETGSAETEKAIYSNIDETRVPKPAGYPDDAYTDPNNFVSKLNGNGHKIGTGIVLKVMSGDKFNIRANAWHNQGGSDHGTPVSPLNDLLALMAQGVSGAANSMGKFTVTQLQQDGVLNPGISNMLTKQGSDYTNNSSRPKAYLNWVLFDEQFGYVGSSSGFEQVGEAGEFKTWVKTNLPINSNGYIYVYTSNESPVDVFFDNLQVTHVRGPLLEETHYYPFGLTMAGISSKAAGKMENKRKFNGGSELQDKEFSDGSGLEMYATQLRMLDPQLGRWWQLDSKPDHAQSLYSAMGNNPILYNDILGDTLPRPVPVANFLSKGAHFGLNGQYQTEPVRGSTVTGIRDTKAGGTNAAGKVKGVDVVRVDEAHGKGKSAIGPHLNINEKVTGVPDPHTPLSSTQFNALKTTGQVLDGVNKVALPFAITTDALQLGNAIKTDIQQGTGGDNTIVTGSRIAGGWAGAWGGAQAGSALGMGIGSLFPGPGTAIGGFIGGIAGGIWGAIKGSSAGEKIGNNVVELKNQ